MASYSAWDSLNEGLLPKWLLLVSAISLGNTIQSFLTLSYTRRIYHRSPASVTPLGARTFGAWTVLAAIVRLYAATHIRDPHLYQLALATYGVAAAHFGSEWLWFGTAGWGAGLAGPVVVSLGSLAWMAWVWGEYVG